MATGYKPLLSREADLSSIDKTQTGHQHMQAALQRPPVGEWHPAHSRPSLPQFALAIPHTYCTTQGLAPRHCPAPQLLVHHSPLDLAATLQRVKTCLKLDVRCMRLDSAALGGG